MATTGPPFAKKIEWHLHLSWQLKLDDWLLFSPKRIRQPGEPVDCESLHRKQDHRDFDDREFSRHGDDTQRDDKGRRSRGRVAHLEQCHQRTRSRKRQGGRQNSGAMNAAMHGEGWSVGHCKRERRITADKPDRVSPDRIAWACGLRQRREEKEICSWTERRKDEWAAGKESEQGQDRDGDKTIYANIDSPHQARREMLQQPLEPQVRQQDADVFQAALLNVRMALFGPLIGELHQMLGRRSKYSSSSFLPPSPKPIVFSDSMNSMRSIHLTIL